VAFRPTIARGLALLAVFFEKIILSDLRAISMPTGTDRCKQWIMKRILNRSNFSENHRSDTSCHNPPVTSIVVVTRRGSISGVIR